MAGCLQKDSFLEVVCPHCEATIQVALAGVAVRPAVVLLQDEAEKFEQEEPSGSKKRNLNARQRRRHAEKANVASPAEAIEISEELPDVEVVCHSGGPSGAGVHFNDVASGNVGGGGVVLGGLHEDGRSSTEAHPSLDESRFGGQSSSSSNEVSYATQPLAAASPAEASLISAELAAVEVVCHSGGPDGAGVHFTDIATCGVGGGGFARRLQEDGKSSAVAHPSQDKSRFGTRSASSDEVSCAAHEADSSGSGARSSHPSSKVEASGATVVCHSGGPRRAPVHFTDVASDVGDGGSVRGLQEDGKSCGEGQKTNNRRQRNTSHEILLRSEWKSRTQK